MSIQILSEMFPGMRPNYLQYAFALSLPEGRSALVLSWPACDGYQIYIYKKAGAVGNQEIACHQCDSVLQAAGVLTHYLGGNECTTIRSH
jgi:hypothetical protein